MTKTISNAFCLFVPKYLCLSKIWSRSKFTNCLSSLHKRKIFAQQLPDPLTPDLVQDLNASKTWSAYCGIDPTGSSLHLGHLFPLMALLQLRKHGYPVIVLLGGATAQIGDPSDKQDERQQMSKDYLQENTVKIQRQLEKLDERFCSLMSDVEDVPEMRVVNNCEWYGEEKLIPFLANHARVMHVNHMVSLKFVKDRLTSGSVLNLSEFFYQFLQAYDFAQLYRRFNCRAQVGGSDQWGNMLGGYEFVKSTQGVRTLSLTTPLLLSGDSKMGKSDSTSQVWLDPTKTTPYVMYQYFLQRTDAESPQLARALTLSDDEQLNDILDCSQVRAVQQFVARSVVDFVHGDESLQDAELISSVLHQKKPTLAGVVRGTLDKILKSVTVLQFSEKDTVDTVLTHCEFFGNRQEVVNSVQNGSVKIDGVKLTDAEVLCSRLCPDHYSVLSIGKHYRAVLSRKT